MKIGTKKIQGKGVFDSQFDTYKSNLIFDLKFDCIRALLMPRLAF